MKMKLLFCLMVFQSALLFGMEPDDSSNNVNNVVEGTISVIGKPFYSLDDCKWLKDVFDTTVEIDDPIVMVKVGNEKCSNLPGNDWAISLRNCPKHKKEFALATSFFKAELKLHKDTMSIMEKNLNQEALTEFKSLLLKCENLLNMDKKQETFDRVVNSRNITSEDFLPFVPPFISFSFLDRKKEGEYFTKQMFGVTVKLKCNGVQDPNHEYVSMLPFHIGLQKLKENFANNPRWEEGEEERLVEKGILVKKGLIARLWTGNIYDHGPNSSIVKNQKN